MNIRRYSVILLVASIILTCSTSWAYYAENNAAGEEEYLAFAEQMPEPIGGMAALIKNIQYPEMAKRAGVEGRVYVLAYIDTDGSCVDVKVIKGVGGGCDEAAAAAVKKTKFNAGKNKGQAVKVKLSLPIEFKLK